MLSQTMTLSQIRRKFPYYFLTVHGSVPDPDPNPDPPDPHVFVPPGSGSTSRRYGSGSGSLYHPAEIVRKTLIPIPTIL